MNARTFSNKEYLELFLSGKSNSVGKVLLPHEKEAVEKAAKKQKNTYTDVVEQTKPESGGDDRRGVAFATTDKEAKTIGLQMAVISPYIGATVVEYPVPGESRATLGSRVLVNQNGYSFPIDIVSFRWGYPDDVTSAEFEDEVMGISPDAPLAAVILGKTVGFEGLLHIAGSDDLQVTIENIDQMAIQLHFMPEVQIIEIIE